jgi:cytochrome P450
MSLAGPPRPVSNNPVVRLRADLRTERAARVPFPRGEKRFSMRRTHRALVDPLGLLLDAYAEHGPVFALRLFHSRVVWMLGPEANHYMTVSHAAQFSWREGNMGDLIPLLGDGLLTIDGDFHRRSRRIMLPAFHHDRIAAMSDLMAADIEAAVAAWRPGDELDLYGWTRHLALRIALRALFGVDPDRATERLDAARQFETALGFWGREYILQVLRGPLTPWAQMQRARRRLDAMLFGEIADRRRTGERGEDILSLLLDAQDEDGGSLSDQHVRDEVMTLLFAGHDTTTATVTFLFRELARAPEWADRAAAGAQDLELCLDETLRLWPPAWVGPRRAMTDYEFAGQSVPEGAFVNYSSWVSHRLPDVWSQPDAFRPERFAPGAREQIPKSAYIPFGGGSRTCIGMRFGQQEIRLIAARILQDFRLELPADHRLEVRQTPTLGPVGGLGVRVRAAA